MSIESVLLIAGIGTAIVAGAAYAVDREDVAEMGDRIGLYAVAITLTLAAWEAFENYREWLHHGMFPSFSQPGTPITITPATAAPDLGAKISHIAFNALLEMGRDLLISSLIYFVVTRTLRLRASRTL